MARPSLKTEKHELILQAYERCIALYGIEGATLQKVAEEAQMARPLLRHYVGNQAELLAQSVERYFLRQQAIMNGFQDIDSVSNLLDCLFDSSYGDDAQDANDIMIATAFTIAAQQNTFIKQQMQHWFKQLQRDMHKVLSNLYPSAKTAQLTIISTGVIGVYFNLFSMQPVDNSAEFFNQSRAAAELLLHSLQP